MQRRTFLHGAMAIAGSAHLPCGAMLSVVSKPEITRVLLITKCHLDVGFTATQAKVKQQYFQEHFPRAMRTAATLRAGGQDRYTWTTGSWLLYEYMEQAGPAERRQIEAAVAANDLSWHALPFSWQTEMLERSMMAGGLGFSALLDRRFGRRTTGAKMTDVPGHSRSLVAPLVAAGVRLLDIGVNAASTPPEVPDLFLWKDSAGNTLPVMYHRHDYGSVIPVPGTGVAIAVVVRGDNSGPHTPAEIAGLYVSLRKQFPAANVSAATLNHAAAVVDSVRGSLPVVTGEIGDTWIYGVGSDPEKVSAFRAAQRLREHWIAQGRLKAGDAVDIAWLRRLLLAAEHTWGTDTKTYLDTNHYLPKDLATVLDQPGYRTMRVSWAEKRDDISQSMAILPGELRREAEQVLLPTKTTPPSTAGMRPHGVGQTFTSKHYEAGIDSVTGAVTHLKIKSSGQQIASTTHPLALFTYQTLSAETYAGFLKRYVKSEEDWAPRGFGKPGIERFGAVDREWHPRLVNAWAKASSTEDRLVLQLSMTNDERAGQEAHPDPRVAWPESLWTELRFPANAPEMHITFYVLRKPENRMPEALWLTFQPHLQSPYQLVLEKGSEPVNANNVIRGGGRAMHCVTGGVHFKDARGTVTLHSLDTGLVVLGTRSPLNFSLDEPSLEQGVHFSLFNNAWGTNYPQWCGGSWSYRFRLGF